MQKNKDYRLKERFSDGVQALITCTPQIASLSNIYSGFDTVHLSGYADLSDSVILEEIEKAREVAREFEQDSIPFTYFSPQYNVHRSGRRFFTYHISTADTHIYFNERSVNGNFPTFLIEIGSISSHSPGPFEVFEQIIKYFKSCGISIRKHHVTRVDQSVDFVNIKISDFNLDDVNKWISRARTFSTYYINKALSGITVGKGDSMIRIYEKRTEMNEKRATAKQKFFNRKWGLATDDKTTPIIRIEVQSRRKVLKEFRMDGVKGIESMDDLEKSKGALFSYFINGDWARHCEEKVDRIHNHQSRFKLSKFWLLVQSVKFDGGQKTLYRHREKNQYINVDAIIDQGVGCLVTAVAATLDSIDDFKQVSNKASSIVWNRLQYKLKFHESELLEKIQIAFNRNHLNPTGITT